MSSKLNMIPPIGTNFILGCVSKRIVSRSWEIIISHSHSAPISPQNLNTMPNFELHAERKTCEFSGGPPYRAGVRTRRYKHMQDKKAGFVPYREEKAKGRASCHFLSYLMGTGKCRAELFFVVHSAKDERHMSQIAGREIQRG